MKFRPARVSLAAQLETMRKVVVSDLIRLAKEKVRTFEDLRMYRWTKTLDQDTGHMFRASTMEREVFRRTIPKAGGGQIRNSGVTRRGTGD